MAWKKRDNAPFLIVNGMEIEEARTSGMTSYTYSDFGYYELFAQHQNDPLKALVALFGVILERISITTGKIGLYGVGEYHRLLATVDALREAYPHYQFVGETGTTLFDEATLTKSDDELVRIKSVAERTNAVMQATWDFIGGHDVGADEVLITADGTPLTIGAVKGFVRRVLLDRQLEDTGMIFAQGRDAGFPHSRGQDDMPVRLGQSIVFDLFPRELGGGYHHDMTRTWCIGYAPPKSKPFMTK